MKKLPVWEQVISAACHLQQILPSAVLVGGTSASLYAQHRISQDADHVLTDLREQFDHVLAQLESVAGWKTARIKRPVLILGKLDGIETGIRQLIREKPLETTTVETPVGTITMPTEAEILRIKAALIIKRNATRDYLDFAALSYHLGAERACAALILLDELYPQLNDESMYQQLIRQIADPRPYDLDEVDLQEYKALSTQWQAWETVAKQCNAMAVELLIYSAKRDT